LILSLSLAQTFSSLVRLGPLARSLSFSSASSTLARSDLSFLTAAKSFLSCFSLASGPRSSSGSLSGWASFS